MLSWLLIHLNYGRPRSQLLVSAPPPSLHNAAATAPAAYTLNFLEAWKGRRWKIKGRRAQKRAKIACKRNSLILTALHQITAFCAIKYDVLTFFWRYLPPINTISAAAKHRFHAPKTCFPPPERPPFTQQNTANRRPKGRKMPSASRQTASPPVWFGHKCRHFPSDILPLRAPKQA